MNIFLLLVALGCFIAVLVLSNILDSQKAAERWQGDSEQEFTQLSCFIPADRAVTLSDVMGFREAMMQKFKEASLDVSGDARLFADAWSCVNKVSVASSLGRGDVYATAVGGEFFTFHPIKLISGSYISETDLMKDRVLLDEDTAWLLFGSTDIAGMTFKIEAKPFVVAGVIEREEDFASSKAYTEGMGIFMPYEAFLGLDSGAEPPEAAPTLKTQPGEPEGGEKPETQQDAAAPRNTSIQCYEVVMPQPVKGFAEGIAKDKFPIGRGEIINNTRRYSFSKLFDMIGQFGARSMQNRGIIYPYWENAARYIEDWAALLLFLSCAAAFIPAVFLLWLIIRGAVFSKRELENNYLPRFKGSVEEQIRRQGRKRWEKQHGVGPEGSQIGGKSSASPRLPSVGEKDEWPGDTEN
ncbi:MAG: ABC transporter permease [Candidatus Limivicinus sp.]